MNRKQFEEILREADFTTNDDINYEFVLMLVLNGLIEEAFTALDNKDEKKFFGYIKQCITIARNIKLR